MDVGAEGSLWQRNDQVTGEFGLAAGVQLDDPLGLKSEAKMRLHVKQPLNYQLWQSEQQQRSMPHLISCLCAAKLISNCVQQQLYKRSAYLGR